MNEPKRLKIVTDIEPAILATQVVKAYGPRIVLNRLNLSIMPGEFVAVIGYSGCGKSTLLRTLQGLERIDDGSIQIDGIEQTRPCHTARTVFQDGRLLPWKTVESNIWLADPKASRQEVSHVLHLVGLEDRNLDWPSCLSGGEMQRVALARALLARPKLMYLDEPLASLDALTKLKMQELIQQLWQANSVTTVLVTHDIEEAVYLADCIYYMIEGQFSQAWVNDLTRPRRRDCKAFQQLIHDIRSQLLPKQETILPKAGRDIQDKSSGTIGIDSVS